MYTRICYSVDIRPCHGLAPRRRRRLARSIHPNIYIYIWAKWTIWRKGSLVPIMCERRRKLVNQCMQEDVRVSDCKWLLSTTTKKPTFYVAHKRYREMYMSFYQFECDITTNDIQYGYIFIRTIPMNWEYVLGNEMLHLRKNMNLLWMLRYCFLINNFSFWIENLNLIVCVFIYMWLRRNNIHQKCPVSLSADTVISQLFVYLVIKMYL